MLILFVLPQRSDVERDDKEESKESCAFPDVGVVQQAVGPQLLLTFKFRQSEKEIQNWYLNSVMKLSCYGEL